MKKTELELKRKLFLELKLEFEMKLQLSDSIGIKTKPFSWTEVTLSGSLCGRSRSAYVTV